ncbi:MAG: hypothetical protein WCP39_00830, partial [Chlamydiota bacterium]
MSVLNFLPYSPLRGFWYSNCFVSEDGNSLICKTERVAKDAFAKIKSHLMFNVVMKFDETKELPFEQKTSAIPLIYGRVKLAIFLFLS